jgi:hypothetical protein
VGGGGSGAAATIGGTEEGWAPETFERIGDAIRKGFRNRVNTEDGVCLAYIQVSPLPKFAHHLHSINHITLQHQMEQMERTVMRLSLLHSSMMFEKLRYSTKPTSSVMRPRAHTCSLLRPPLHKSIFSLLTMLNVCGVRAHPLRYTTEPTLRCSCWSTKGCAQPRSV